jgi:hypothetical protein
MVQRFPPALGGGNGDTQVLLNPGLPDKIVERFRPEAGIQRNVLGAGFTRDNALYSNSPPGYYITSLPFEPENKRATWQCRSGFLSGYWLLL